MGHPAVLPTPNPAPDHPDPDTPADEPHTPAGVQPTAAPRERTPARTRPYERTCARTGPHVISAAPACPFIATGPSTSPRDDTNRGKRVTALVSAAGSVVAGR